MQLMLDAVLCAMAAPEDARVTKPLSNHHTAVRLRTFTHPLRTLSHQTVESLSDMMLSHFCEFAFTLFASDAGVATGARSGRCYGRGSPVYGRTSTPHIQWTLPGHPDVHPKDNSKVTYRTERVAARRWECDQWSVQTAFKSTQDCDSTQPGFDDCIVNVEEY